MIVTKTPLGPGRYAVAADDGRPACEAVRRPGASGWLCWTNGVAYRYPTLAAIIAAVSDGEV